MPGQSKTPSRRDRFCPTDESLKLKFFRHGGRVSVSLRAQLVYSPRESGFEHDVFDSFGNG